MTELVLVHGIGPVNQTAETLRIRWTEALSRALCTHGHGPVARQLEQGETRVSMAYYRHLFTPYVPEDDLHVPFPEGMAVTGGEVGEDIIANISRHAEDPVDREQAALELRELWAETGPEQGPYAPVRVVVGAMGRLGPIARSGFAALVRIGVFHLGQVAAYLDDETVREGAIDAVLSEITPDTKAVVAHSLGTVVAYEALHRLERRLPLLVTCGSPLGLRSIVQRRLRPSPLSTPAALKSWVNVADRDDYVVATLELRRLFADAGGVLQRTRLVKNRNSDPHSALDYLGHAQLVDPLAAVL